ncbi:lipopolysaccharide kinase InaA family protein [Escherichia coli]
MRYFVNWKLAVLCALKWRAKLFSKWHRGTTLKEIIKNLLSLRMPVLGADREWNAIHRLRDVGVDTMMGWHWRKRHESADQNFIHYYRRSDTNHKSGRLLC